jgi:hypothetical protein
MKSLFRPAASRLTFAIFLLLTGVATHAQSTDPVTVRYLGAQDDMLVFNVYYDNPQGTKFTVAIRDQNGTQLYQDNFKDKLFYRQFRLPKADKDRVVFVIRSGEEAPVVKTFAVNVSSRLVREVAIKKL